MVVEESEDVESVVVLGRVTMLGAETVVNGDDKSREFAGETAANGVVGFGSGAEVSEATSVEENDDGKGRGGVGGGEETEPEGAGGVEGDVRGGNGVDGGGISTALNVQEIGETTVDGAVKATAGVADSGDDRQSKSRFPWDGRFCGIGGAHSWREEDTMVKINGRDLFSIFRI